MICQEARQQLFFPAHLPPARLNFAPQRAPTTALTISDTRVQGRDKTRLDSFTKEAADVVRGVITL
jgi:hypothetical protein